MRPTSLHVGGVLYWTLRTRDPDTMALKDADATPTVAVRKNGSAVGDSVTITKRSATTGLYDCSYNPATEAEGDTFEFEERAQVTGTATAQAYYDSGFVVRVRAVERGTDGANTVVPANSDIAAAKTAAESVAAMLPNTDFLVGAATDEGYAVLNTATQTQITEIKAKTDNLPSDPADQSATEAAITSATSVLATAANLATVAGYIDTEVAAIKTKTDQMVFGETNSLNVNVIHYNGTLQSNGDLPQKLDSIQSSVNDTPTNSELTTALAAADDAVLAAISALNNLSAAQVNAELLDVLSVDTFAELSAPPSASSSLKDKLVYLFMWARNKSTQTVTERKLYADDGTTVISTESVSDAGGTFTKGEAS